MNKQEILKKHIVKKGYKDSGKSLTDLKSEDRRTPISYRMRSATKALLESEAEKLGFDGYQRLMTSILDEWVESRINELKGRKKEESYVLMADLEAFMKEKKRMA